MSNELGKRFIQSKKIDLNSLFTSINDSYHPDPPNEDLFSSGFHFKNGHFFKIREEQKAVINEFAKSLVKAGREIQIGIKESQEIPLNAFILCLEKNSVSLESFKQYLQSEIDKQSSQRFNLIIRTRIFRFRDDIQRLENEKISVLPATECITRIPFPTTNENWRIISVEEDIDRIREGIFTCNIRGINWHINAECTKENLLGHSRWLANAFISFFRLSTALKTSYYRPAIGKVEPEPFYLQHSEYEALGYNQHGWTGLTQFMQEFYEVGNESIQIFSEEETQILLNRVFQAKKGSIAERARDGLSWLSRGRQSSDHSERLLFFFTAIESLLMNSEPSVQVTETLSRYCSILFTKNIERRETAYRKIKDLYKLRSKLVHRGTREVDPIDANLIQYIAESVYLRILTEVDLRKPHNVLIESLSSASHGKEWQCS